MREAFIILLQLLENNLQYLKQPMINSNETNHSRNVFNLCVKTSRRTKPLIWNCVSQCTFIFMWIKRIFKWKVLLKDPFWNRSTTSNRNGQCSEQRQTAVANTHSSYYGEDVLHSMIDLVITPHASKSTVFHKTRYRVFWKVVVIIPFW